MCGRYELHSNPSAIALAFGLATPPDLPARYNIAPTQQVPIIRVNAAGERELVQVRWGLVPRWARDPSIASKLVNARSETVATRFGIPYRRHRCLFPADGFYDWRPRREGGKQPMLVAMKDRGVFGLAGIYERWLPREGEPLDTCTILTTDANELTRAAHHRMPVIIAPEDYARWLDQSEPDPRDLLRPFQADRMTWWAVSSRVNNVRNDDPACIEPLASDDAEPAAADDAEHVPEQPELF
jgi:putative SOS response-associated peptidase YedK